MQSSAPVVIRRGGPPRKACFPDLPGIGRVRLAGEQHALSIEGNYRICGRYKIREQRAFNVGIFDEECSTVGKAFPTSHPGQRLVNFGDGVKQWGVRIRSGRLRLQMRRSGREKQQRQKQ